MSEPGSATGSGRRPRRGIGTLEWIGIVVAVVALSTISVLPKTSTVRTERTGAPAPGGGGPQRGGTVTGPTGVTGGQGNPGGPVSRPGLVCAAGRNGSATDVGVTGERIRLGATVVDSGIGSAFLGDVRFGMLAVMNRVNASGGICGRRLELVMKDDGWEAQRGKQFIENLVEGERVFALAVVPSSEGLRAADGYVRAHGIPVVGTDGMLISQYTNPVIWPVAASTITGMHVMARNAADRGKKNFAMVYDLNFRFGVEGAFAFNAAHKRLFGRDIPGYSNPLENPRCTARFCGIKAGQPSYQTELEVVRSACAQAPACDYVVYLLEPETALTWMRGGGIRSGGGVEVAGPQPLFNRGFGVQCAQRCHDMWVWTGFVPPVEPFLSRGPVAAYVNDLRRTNAQADANNSFVEGGYLGMKLLVDALTRLGPNVTRRGLIQVLDATRLDSGLSSPLSFRPGNHFANPCMMAFAIQSRPSFAGWRQATEWVCDPWLGQDLPGER